MARYGMLIDTRSCVGCFACRVACARQNGLTPTTPLIRFEEHETGTYPQVSVETVPIQCMHCDDAPCAAVCPTGATYIDENGIVQIDVEKCIGCQACMEACPYGARVYDETANKVDKCRFCASQFVDGTPNCSCVAACLTGARMFGDLDDPDSDISKAIAELGAQPLIEGVTQPKVLYVR